MRGNIPDNMKKFIEENKGLQAYRKKNGKTAARRFWNLFRSDLMRYPPDKVNEYLKDEQSKLAEAGSFGNELASRYFDGKPEEEQRVNQEDLIYACLEMDAAWRLSQFERDEALRKALSGKLKIWRIP